MRWWDIDQVVAIERESFTADAWTPEMFWSELAETGTRQYRVAAAEDGSVAGYIGVSVVGVDADVQTIAVHPAHRGQGLGRALLADGLARARSRGARRIHLEVRADNDAALALYTADGFDRTGRRRGYYATPAGPVDAVLMTRSLVPLPASAR